jgi:enoyl-CoA hydratase/carnithine racemase
MSHLLVDVDGRGVATVVFDHPPINLMTIEVLLETAQTADRLAADDSVRAIVLRSANPEWFIAHFDVEAIQSFPTEQPPTDPSTGELNVFDHMCETFRTMPKPTIAVIEGRAGGGGSELALSCDMRFATPGAILSQPEVALGIIPGGGGTVRLPRLVGRGRALEAILGCDDIDAATAERWGWVNRVLEPGEIGPFVDRLAGRIAAFPAHAVAAAKASVLASERRVTEDLISESNAFNATLGVAETRAVIERSLDLGVQTPEGERRLGELAGEITD